MRQRIETNRELDRARERRERRQRIARTRQGQARDRRGAAGGKSMGQSLVIFALTFTALIAILGLAVDVVRIYDLYARMQRAAEAGALAGVLYLPNNYARAYASPGDGKSAVSRALEEVVKNGFGAPAASPNFRDCPNPPDPGQKTVCSACPNPPSSIEVAVCPVQGKATDLVVYITEPFSAILLGAIGVGPTRITAQAQAEYLPSMQIGSRAGYFGDQMECSPGNAQNTNSYACDPNDTSANHLQYFMATMDGPAELKESGDPMVYCAEGPGEISGTDPTSTVYTYNGYQTNHAQWSDVTGNTTNTKSIAQHCGVPQSGGNPGNPDYQPAGYAGPATAGTPHPGGYNYQISISSSVTAGSLWIFNPNYIPTDTASLPPDRFIDNGWRAPNFYHGPLGEGIGTRFDGSHYDAPLFYFTTTITLYKVGNLYDRSTDTLVKSVAYSPYDNMTADLALHGCGAGQVYNPYWNGGNTANFYHNPGQIIFGQGCVSAPTCLQQWCQFPVAGGLAPGTYRLVVEATGLNANTSDYQSGSTDGWGQHSYALKVCDSTGLTTPVGCGGANGAGQYNTPPVAVYAWNNMDIVFQSPLATRTPNTNYPQSACVNNNTTAYTCMDLGCIPTQYAGRTVTVGLYDIGDGQGSGNLYLAVVPPSGSGGSVAYPSWTTTTSIDGNQAVKVASGSSRPYNGLWFDATITLPPNYVGLCDGSNSGWWQVMYASGSGFQPTDKLGVTFNLVGSPLHLTTLG